VSYQQILEIEKKIRIRQILKVVKQNKCSLKEITQDVECDNNCNEVTRKRSRWRKNSVLSPSRARKLARSRLPQPSPPNPPRNPCFFRPTIPGLRADQSSPTATAASPRPRAATESTKVPRRACRAHSDSDSDPPPDSPSTSSEPAPDTTSDSDSASDPRLPASSLP
jgi:hypothetical protein